jgi:hypothetical protein
LALRTKATALAANTTAAAIPAILTEFIGF